MPAAFFCQLFSKISGQSFADACLALKKANHVVYALDLKVFFISKQRMHFFGHLIDMKRLGQNVVDFHCLP